MVGVPTKTRRGILAEFDSLPVSDTVAERVVANRSESYALELSTEDSEAITKGGKTYVGFKSLPVSASPPSLLTMRNMVGDSEKALFLQNIVSFCRKSTENSLKL